MDKYKKYNTYKGYDTNYDINSWSKTEQRVPYIPPVQYGQTTCYAKKSTTESSLDDSKKDESHKYRTRPTCSLCDKSKVK